MAGERQLSAGGEDAHSVVRGRIGGREQEGRLAQVRPLRERLHPCRVERVGAVDDGERVAEQRLLGEDVDLGEGEGGAHDATSSAAARARTPRSIASGATVTNDRRKVFFIASPA